jgi:NAD(P)-dependent dehydrogenase (short-subunit alcohol dehydrogenase family)
MIDYLKKFSLDKKTAYIIGGLGLIGSEVSTAFASYGARTIILDLESEKGIAFAKKLDDAGHEAYFGIFDCRDMENLETNFTSLLNEYGLPDVFINCSYPRTSDWGKSSFKEITLSSFRQNVDIHMNSHSWLVRLVAEAMVKGGNGGSIILFGSTYGVLGQDLTVYEGTNMHENMTYSAIKGGIINFARQAASYYGQFNIRVNTICPGGLEGHVAGKSATQNPIFVSQYSKKTPLKRLGRAEEIAPSAVFLASDAASYITGSIIMVDGGWAAI